MKAGIGVVEVICLRKRGRDNEEDTEKHQSKLIYRVEYSQAWAIHEDKASEAFLVPN